MKRVAFILCLVVLVGCSIGPGTTAKRERLDVEHARLTLNLEAVQTEEEAVLIRNRLSEIEDEMNESALVQRDERMEALRWGFGASNEVLSGVMALAAAGAMAVAKKGIGV